MARSAPFTILARFVCVMLALHFFNFSIDPIDKHADSIPEDLSINDIESVSELVVEVVFSAGDIFAEHDEPDSDEGGSLRVCKLFLTDMRLVIVNQQPIEFSLQFSVAPGERIVSRATNVVSPPPKALA